MHSISAKPSNDDWMQMKMKKKRGSGKYMVKGNWFLCEKFSISKQTNMNWEKCHEFYSSNKMWTVKRLEKKTPRAMCNGWHG